MSVWVWCVTEPCPYCAVWTGPHRHLLRSDGTLGNVVEAVERSPDGWKSVIMGDVLGWGGKPAEGEG
jgi:hypothetical protein